MGLQLFEQVKDSLNTFTELLRSLSFFVRDTLEDHCLDQQERCLELALDQALKQWLHQLKIRACVSEHCRCKDFGQA